MHRTDYAAKHLIWLRIIVDNAERFCYTMPYDVELRSTSMIREQAIANLQDLINSGDTEIAHSNADDILCQLLISLGYQDVVDAWNKIDKWYA